MKTLFCCGLATHTGQGQSGLWRWWFYYRPLKELFGATHFCCNNDGNTNLPNEGFVKLHDGTQPIPPLAEDQLNFIHWPDSLPPKGLNCPGYYRSVATMARVAQEQGFDKLVYVEWDFWVVGEEMMREIGAIKQGLVAYWAPRYVFPDCNIIIAGRDQFNALKACAERLGGLENFGINDIGELAFPWTEVRKHRVGDRYPEYTETLPASVEYCAQLPNTMLVHKGKLVRLAWDLCRKCGGNIEFNDGGHLDCRRCNPEGFSSQPAQ